MPVNYSIRAEIVDIRTDTPVTTDAFIVDSNVWFWMTYSKAKAAGRPYQTTDYPKYVSNALATGARIFRSGLSLAELAHLIEKTEREIYLKINPGLTLTPKEYRHNLTAERENVVAEVRTAWVQVKSLAEPLSVAIDERTTDAALCRFQTELVDGYDLFILEAMASNGIMQIITDDGDFASIPNIRVFTSNRNVIQMARIQNRMRIR